MTPSTIRKCAVVVPDDVASLPENAVRLWVGVAGDIKLNPQSLSYAAVVFKAVPVGWFDMPCRKVWATGTTATDLVAIIDI